MQVMKGFRNMTTTSHSESDEQIGFVSWFEDRFKGVRIFHIPNGGHRSMSVAKKLKAEGVKPGVPDLFVPHWRLWIEMKRTKGGRLSEEQKDWIEYLEGIGYSAIVANGATEASRKVLEWLASKKA